MIMGSDNFCDRKSVLVVDDSPEILALITRLLEDRHRVFVANGGVRALKLARTLPQPDLILLDVMMSGMSGWEVCGRLKSHPDTRDIPVIFLTASSTPEDETKGFDLGAMDFIAKPVHPPTLLARVSTQLKIKAAADFLKDNNDYLEQEVARRTRELAAIQDVTVLTLAGLAETRDNDTGNHLKRTQLYVRILAERLSQQSHLAVSLDAQAIDTLFRSAPLHDIGKVGVPDRILLKPGKLTSDEFEIMKTHTTLGHDAIRHAEKQLGIEVGFLACAKEIALSHQEKWDGSGYPKRLAGSAIPLSARLMAVADVYDALISRRVYKEGMPHDKAVAIILAGKGNHFDPDVVDAFLATSEVFKTIADQYADSVDDVERKARQLASIVGDGT